MQRSSSHSRRPSAWLAAGLAALLSAAALAAPQRGRAAGLRVDIAAIGATQVRAENRSEAQRADAIVYYVGPKEAVAIKVAGSLPPLARLYPLVRRQGEDVWTVQPEAVGPDGRRVAGEWKAEVRFGGSNDAGERFELRALVAAEPLPQGRLPEGMRAGNLRAESKIVRVKRHLGRPSVTVSSVAGHEVYGNTELMVHEEDWIGVVARDLPDESSVGVAVQPAGTGRVWIMPERAGESGSILAYFGLGNGSELSFHYTVSAFIARDKAWPPETRDGLPPQVWQRYQTGFLAESLPVPVVRWQRHLQIEQIGRIPLLPGVVLAVDRQVDVRGAAQRPLAPRERIWIVCIPLQGDPWVAGWTPQLTASGHWGIRAVQLHQDGKPATFDVVAVVSADDATQVRPGALRKWLHGVESEDVTTRITLLARDARPASPTRPGRRRR